MKRIADFLNFCIVTNRNCNLRCKHCFVSSELFEDKNQMSQETFRKAYEQLFRIIETAPKLKFLNVETLGGEITMMPYEFWESMIPFALEQHDKLEQVLGRKSTLLWCTNLMIKDERYYELINKYKDHPSWSLFIPWEPDTNRFGKGDKLFPRYWRAVQKIKAKKAFNFIPTKMVIEMPFGEIEKLIHDGGFSDISCDMLYPFGSGEAFFDENQPDFEKVSSFYKKLSLAFADKKNFDVSPWDEYTACLLDDASLNINGNELLDISIEPNGDVFLNSSMTGSFAPESTMPLNINDKLFAEKLIFESSSHMHLKFDSKYPCCEGCSYLKYCNGGYFYYKKMDAERLSALSTYECPGLKSYWEFCDEKINRDLSIISHKNHTRELTKIRSGLTKPELISTQEIITKDPVVLVEQISELSRNRHKIMISKDVNGGKSLVKRLWFYETLGFSVDISSSCFMALSNKDKNVIIGNVVHGTYEYLNLSHELVRQYAETQTNSEAVSKLKLAIEILEADLLVEDSEKYTKINNNLEVSPLYEELFRYCLDFNQFKNSAKSQLTISSASKLFLDSLRRNVHLEQELKKYRDQRVSQGSLN